MIKKTKYGTSVQILKNMSGNMVMVIAITKNGQYTTIVDANDIENYENDINQDDHINQE